MTLPVALAEEVNLVSSIVVGLDFLHPIEYRTSVSTEGWELNQEIMEHSPVKKGGNANHHLAAKCIVRSEISTAFRRLLLVCYILNMRAVTEGIIDESNGASWLSMESLDQCFTTFVRARPGKFFFHKTRARSH